MRGRAIDAMSARQALKGTSGPVVELVLAAAIFGGMVGLIAGAIVSDDPAPVPRGAHCIIWHDQSWCEVEPAP